MRIVSILLLLALVLTCGTAFASDSPNPAIPMRLERVERWVDGQFVPGEDNCQLIYRDGGGMIHTQQTDGGWTVSVQTEPWLLAIIACH